MKTMVGIRVMFVSISLFFVFANLPIIQAEDSSEYICENAVWFTFYCNDFILSQDSNIKEDSSIKEIPRNWIKVVNSYISRSSNPLFDNMQLYDIFEEFDRLFDETLREEKGISDIYLRNREGTEWNMRTEDSKKLDNFYLIVEYKDGSTFVYNGALVRIGIPVGDIKWSKLKKEETLDEINRRTGEIFDEMATTLRSIINESHSYNGEFFAIFSICQIDTVKKEGSEEKFDLKEIEKTETDPSWQWHEGRFAHLHKGIVNFFTRTESWNIDNIWEITWIYSLYYESKRLISLEFENLEDNEIFPGPKFRFWTFYSEEITWLENDINFFSNAMTSMEYWVGLTKECLLVDENDIYQSWDPLRSTSSYFEGIAQMKLDKYRQFQTVNLALLFFLISILISVMNPIISFLLRRKSVISTLYMIPVVPVLLFLFLFLCISISSKTGAIVIITGFFGFVTAYWRYELSKYNEIARKALDKFTEVFQKELQTEQITRLSSILMTLATFNSTNAWLQTKWIMNRFLGLDYDLKFKSKTPRYFEELTEITEAINKDNEIKEMVRFLPTQCFHRDRNYKEWLDLAIELSRTCLGKKNYEMCKCVALLKRYVDFGCPESINMELSVGEHRNDWFDKELADTNFNDFAERHKIQGIDKHMAEVFSENMKEVISCVETHLREKGCSPKQLETVLEAVKDRWGNKLLSNEFQEI